MGGVCAEVMDGEEAAAPPMPSRGIKRLQDDSLDDDQRFAKRFHLLNIDNQNKLYIPVSNTPQQRLVHPDTDPKTNSNNDHMQLDDTKHRVYIHSLDDELADVESDEEKLIFLPDIEKRLSKIPRHILTGSKPESKDNQELVLYTIPSSLSVPEERDSVRKAILESRQRAREKAAQEAIDDVARGPDNPEIAHGLDVEDYSLDDDSDNDPDAMDIG